ncbi:MBL fold metallo-hydrolase [Archangium violaceum]|uniref:MBL fold metallo-hydrolase n=1 Tax=Archangium violaceum TaxID=83451 RepID=UPI002B2A588D|nr:MBL fold metallo-hydrolase [Archangium violaceum]
MSAGLAITRVVNASVLLELSEGAPLSDPCLDDRWYYGFSEPIGLRAHQLPRLAAILGGHGVFDHWQPASLVAYPYQSETPVLVATSPMARKARAAGFEQVSLCEWGDVLSLPGGLRVEVVASQVDLGLKSNNYVISSAGHRVFIGTEARELEPLRRYRHVSPRVDIVLVPIGGTSVFGKKLVMDPADALEATRILGGHTLIPIHYLHRSGRDRATLERSGSGAPSNPVQ